MPGGSLAAKGRILARSDSLRTAKGDAELLTRNRLLVLAALIGPLVVSAGLSPFRDNSADTNAALLLVLVTVAVAVSGNRVAAVVAAVSGAVWFNFFLTRPYQTFLITDRNHVATTVLLLAVGVGVTELAAWGYREKANAHRDAVASRRRIVAASDETRRRIERDLHDGIQQRLIALSLRARAMTGKPADELPGIAAELSEGLKDVSDELREVSRGIHPTILTKAGLGPALRALARRSHLPIEVDVKLDERLPAPVEAAAYYIASEALTNVAKHAHANVVELNAACEYGVLALEVRDDGIGGVDGGRGFGILGIKDRAEALGGTISIASPPRGGTTLSIRLPITT
jgi:signal transduction histidine kinase